MSTRSPTSWTKASFTDIFNTEGGTQPPKSVFEYEAKPGYIRLLQIRDFGKKPHPTFVPDKKNLSRCVEEDILIGRYGASVGRICSGLSGAYNVALVKVIIPAFINKRFVFHYLKSSYFQQPITSTQRSAQDGFNKSDLGSIDFILPPLAEQHRIVAKLDSILPRVEKVRERLEKIPALVKRFRQSVLTAAVTGKLTEGWREKNPGIGAWRDGFLKEALIDLRYGTAKKCDYEGGKTAVLRIPNVVTGKIELSDLKFADFEKKEIESLEIRANDLLMIRSNGSVSLVGQVARATSGAEGLLFAGYLMRLRIKERIAIPQYVECALKSPSVREYIERTSRSAAGVNNINSGEVESIAISLPSLSEQQEIVRQVDKLFALADKLEAHYHRAMARVEKFPQAILAKAFRGELVPQDPNDEPAEKLLERIRQERAEMESVGRAKKKPSVKPQRAKAKAMA